MPDIDNFVGRLVELAAVDLPRETAVVALQGQPEAWERGLSLAHRLSDLFGWKVREEQTSRRRATRVLRDPDRGRITVFRESGAVSVRASIAPFDELFDGDPGDSSITRDVCEQLDRLGLAARLSEAERLDFERLWRIRAAGSDARGNVSDPVLCRVVGAFRHSVRDLPVLGRASAHIEMTGLGNLSAMSASWRSPLDRGAHVVASVKPRDPVDAATEVASRVEKMLGARGLGDEVQAQSFSFGYLSLGRRRAQAVLAPFFVAAITIEGARGSTKSAHLVPVAGSQERFLRPPRGAAPASRERKPSPPPPIG